MKRCRDCLSPVPTGARRCAHCGARFTTRIDRLDIIAMYVLIVIVVGGLGLWWISWVIG